MASVPGPRTSPTIKPLATMNRGSLQNWEVKLGLIQMVVLVGLITGSVACAFYLGFFSGQRAGFDNALASTIPSVPRMPIVKDSGEEEVPSRVASQVYAKLNETESGSATARRVGDQAMPELGAIPSIEEKPLGSGAVVDEIEADDLAELPVESEPEALDAGVVQKGAEDAVGARGRLDSALNGLGTSDIHEKVSNALGKVKNDKTLGSILATEEEKKLPKAAAVVPGVTAVKPQESTRAPAIKALEKTKPETHATERPRVLASWSESGQPKEAARGVVKEDAQDAKPVPNSTMMKEVIPSGWFAQVAAPRKIEDANSLATKLKKSGFGVVIETADVRGQEYFRVLVGPEEGRKEAQRLVDQLKRESYVQGEPFLKLVK